MKRKATDYVTEAYQRPFERPPHLMPQLSRILAGEWKLTPNIQRQMVAHLCRCDYCQIALEIIVDTTLENSTGTLSTEQIENVQRMLGRFKAINHSIQTQDERIAAYAEMLEMHEAEEASKRYPAFAEHLKHCQECAAAVEDTRKAIIEAANAGLIPPLESGAQMGRK